MKLDANPFGFPIYLRTPNLFTSVSAHLSGTIVDTYIDLHHISLCTAIAKISSNSVVVEVVGTFILMHQSLKSRQVIRRCAIRDAFCRDTIVVAFSVGNIKQGAGSP